MNILYVCTVPGFQVANEVRCFESRGHNVFVINTWNFEWHNLQTYPQFRQVINLYQKEIFTKLVHQIFFPYSKFFLIRLPKVKSLILDLIIKEQINLIYCAWDSGTVIEACYIKKLIKDNNLRIPLVFRFLMYPFGLKKNIVLLENFFINSIINELDGRIWPTNEQYHYAKRHFALNSGGKDIIIPPYLSSYYYPKERLPLLSNKDGEPHLIFIGSTDFTNRERNIKDYIRKITNQNIHLHISFYSKLDSELLNNRYLHLFPNIDMMNLPKFMTQFDGCIILYNFSGLLMDRFNNVLPNRFIWALAAGIPIFFPYGKLMSCENLVRNYKIGETFSNASTLKNLLSNQESMEQFRASAINASYGFAYENYVDNLEKFLTDLISYI